MQNFAKFRFLPLFISAESSILDQPATLLKGAPTQGFSCAFFEIFKNTFFHRTPPVDTYSF